MNKYIRFLFLIPILASFATQADLPGPQCELSPVGLKGSTIVYDNSVSSKFNKNVWGAAITSTDTTGKDALQVQFNVAWGGVEFRGHWLYTPSSVGFVHLSVKGNIGPNIRVYLLDRYDKKLGIDVPLSDYLVDESTANWQEVSVPVWDMLTSSSSISGVGFQSETATTIELDDISFEPTEPEGLITLYDDYSHALVHPWLNNISTNKNEPFHGNGAIEMNVTNAWGGLTLRTDKLISELNYGAITLAVKSTTPNLDLYIYTVNEAGERIGLAYLVSEFLHTKAITADWQVVWVPLRKLIPQPAQSTFIFHGIGVEATMPGKVWVDEVKVVEKLKWPLPEFPVGNYTTGYAFGDEWDQGDQYKCNSLNQLHTATDYSTGGAANKKVVSAHNGVVRYASAGSAKWGGYVIVESSGNAFVTEYTHITPSITVGAEVEAGSTQIGVTAPLPEHTPHLHFTLRVKPYSATDLSMVINGVLPQTNCGGYPKFPEAFVNPRLVDWQ